MDVIADILGKPALELLRSPEFLRFTATRSLDDESDPPEVRYVFEEAGVELLCDPEEELVNTVFVHTGGRLAAQMLEGLALDEVASRGRLDAESTGIDDPVLGRLGPWKRYRFGDVVVHFQFDIGAKDVELTTIMRADVAP